MPDYTTTALLASISSRGLVPTSQSTYQTVDLLALASEELRSSVVPYVMKMRSEYFGYTAPDITIAANQDTYPIPYRAIGGKVRCIQLVDSSGNVADLPQITKEERPFFNGGSTTALTFVFYIEGNNIVLVPKPASSPGSFLRISMYFRPNDLCTVTDAAQITAINTGTNQVTVSVAPSTFTASLPLDMVNGMPGFECKAYDITPTVVASNVLTFSTLPPNLAVGDWLAPAGLSPIPQIPWELHPMLAQHTVIKLLEGINDQQGIQIAEGKLKQLQENAMHLLSPRTDGNPKKLINRFGPLRSWGYRRSGNY